MSLQEKNYKCILEIEQANKCIGKHFFDKSSMRFFSTRIADIVYAGKYFITSEKSQGKGPRRYTIRECVNGNIETIGEFQEYGTLASAKRAVNKL